MVASAIFITDLQGKSIISRNYRGDVPLSRAIERFAKYLMDTPDEQKKPIFQADVNSDFFVEEDVGSTGNQGESYIYVNVSLKYSSKQHPLAFVARICKWYITHNMSISPFISRILAGQFISVRSDDTQFQCRFDLDLSVQTRTSL